MSKKILSGFGDLKKNFHPASPAAAQSARPAQPAQPALSVPVTSPQDLFARMMGDRPSTATGHQLPATGHKPQAAADQPDIADELAASAAALDKLAQKLATSDAACEDLAAKLAAAEAAKTAAEEENARLAAQLAAQPQATSHQPQATGHQPPATSQCAPADDPEIRLLNDELDRLADKNKRLAQELAALKAAPKKALVLAPKDVEEVFEGETREHVLSVLADAQSAATTGGRDRRAALLAKVLAANVPAGTLDDRRAAVKKIVQEAGKFVDGNAIKALEKLGFRDVSNNKHHKLRWAEVTVTLANTPSDYRSADNAAAEINNRVF